MVSQAPNTTTFILIYHKQTKTPTLLHHRFIPQPPLPYFTQTYQ